MGRKVNAILEANDPTQRELNQLIGSLITREIINSNDKKKKKKGLALTASPFANDDDDINNEECHSSLENSNVFYQEARTYVKNSSTWIY